MIGQTLGHYKILDKLGAGGMGEVYRAEDTTLGREVAIKVLPQAFTDDPERLARFEREAKLLATLNHPHIAQIHALEDIDGQKLLVMELVEGETLAEHIARGALPLEGSRKIALQITQALEAAHERGIVHRDLKPANIKVTPQGNVKVLDFGLAKPITDTASSDLSHSPTMTYSPTQAGVLLGTAAYMSPEQARGQEVDKRTDIWAFGVVLWEMLTGKRLFDGDTVSDILAAVLRAEPDWDQLPANTPQAFHRVLQRCLTRDPEDRLHDIADARLDLTGADVPDRLAPGETSASQTSWFWKGLSGVLLLSTLALGGLLLSRQQHGPDVFISSLPPPGGTSYSLEGFQPGPPVLSPDGRHLAFTANDSDGRAMLWVRSLADEEARIIPGTQGAFYPFWSPDSRELAFFSGGMLRRIALDGGQALPISDAPFGKGGSWNREDVILFTPGFSDEIYRVRADGGPAVAATELDPAAQDWTHRFPHFLPDGEHFLFLAGRADSSTGEVRLGSLVGETPRLLLESGSRALFASGYLLFMREGTLMAQAFDLDDLSLKGQASPLASGVATTAGSFNAAFTSSETGLLGFLPSSATPLLQLAWVDRAGVRADISGSPALFADSFALSPDHSEVAAAVIDRGTGEQDIWVFEAAGGQGRRFTFDRGDEGGPVWSPDGKRLAFFAGTNGRHYQLVVQPQDSTGKRLVLLEPEEGLLPIPESWSSDGRWLAYSLFDTTSGKDIVSGWLLPMDPPGTPIQYRDHQDATPFASFSPDGRWLAYTVFEERMVQVYVASFPDRERQWRVSSEAGVAPFWDPKGHSLFFVGGAGELLETPIVATESDFQWSPPRQVLPPEVSFLLGSGFVSGTDGERFLALLPEESTEPAPALTLVLNWPARLKNTP